MRVDGTLESMVVATILLSCTALHTQRGAILVRRASTIGAGAFASSFCLRKGRLYSLVLCRKEDNLRGALAAAIYF